MTTTAAAATAPADPATELLRSASAALRDAGATTDPIHRYERSYLAALRAAAAILACRARPRSLRTRPRGIWTLLARSAPELGEWAEFFAVCGQSFPVSPAVGAGRAGHPVVTPRQADDLLRDAAAFCDLARSCVAHPRPAR